MEQGFLDHMYGDLGSGHLESPVAQMMIR
uniref:Uncharacterized protein n=1 Tax=Anguilla anguilla TaxID=7936 RepID=A0A0E9VUA9_ANGAN